VLHLSLVISKSQLSPPLWPRPNVTSKRHVDSQPLPLSIAMLTSLERACGDPGSLTISLANGQLTDEKGRTGYIASNFQFQFDAPPQDGAIFTGGFSVCSNGSLALGGSAVFFECLSGGFFNLYDRSFAAQCEPILIDILPCSSSGAAGQQSDGQPTGVTVATAVSQISDGQPQAQSAVPITQISDGQPQAQSAVPISQISDGQPQAQSAIPISQISDGQPQVPTGVISQISDGQPQAPKTTAGVPISQISDGQPQAPKTTAGVPISQISDGQIQATTATPETTPAPITQISDGQIQATTAAAGAPISQISDGQIQAPNATVATSAKPSAQTFAGAGNAVTVGSQFAVIVGAVAAFVW
jgi:hypothetical protein